MSIPFRILRETVLAAKGFQLAEVRSKICPKIPAQLALADRTQMQWLSIRFRSIVAAIQVALKLLAMRHAENMTCLV